MNERNSPNNEWITFLSYFPCLSIGKFENDRFLSLNFSSSFVYVAMDAAIQLIQLYEANYPELLHRVFVINGNINKFNQSILIVNRWYLFVAPKVFSIAFSMMKPFLHERTKNKISIFSHEPKQWKAAILTAVNAEELPVAYGGTLTDPDGNPNCITKVCTKLSI